MHGATAAARRVGMGNCGHGKVVGRHGRGMGKSLDVTDESAVDCSSVGLAWDDSFVSSVRVRLRVGQARLGRLHRLVCARSTACRSDPPGTTAPSRLCAFDCDGSSGHGKHGHGKGAAPQMGRARARMGRTGPCPCRLSCRTDSSRLCMWTSNKAVEVAGVHCVQLNSHPSW